MAIARGKPALNRAKVQALTAPLASSRNLAGAGGSPALILLPELFSTGYLDLASAARTGPEGETWEEVAGKDREFLSALARKLKAWVSGPTVEAGAAGGQGPRFRNALLIFAPDGREAARYQKIHPFSYGGEDKLFAGGPEVVTVDIENLVVQPTICYDLRFPELYRAGSQRGVHLILVQANWPDPRQAHWETLLRARAIENQAFVAGVNCVGTQDSLQYAGGSVVLSPKGEALALGGAAEGLVKSKVDLDLCKQWRKAFPALRDRKPLEFYQEG
jgi:predicted amidohydrolase